MFRSIALVLACAFLTSGTADALPKPAESKYFRTAYAGFLIATGEGLFYTMTYEVLGTFETVMYGTVIFQNPGDKKNPYSVNLSIEPGQKEVLVQSPTFARIANKKNYKVQFDLFHTADRNERLNSHVDKVNFSIPVELAAQMGIELL